VFKADEWLRKSGLNGNATIVKATPKPRQHFCPFLQVDRNRAKENRGLSPVIFKSAENVPTINH
jgi:hypothetical protein